MLDTLYNIAAFAVVISVIVFIHEFGHYYIAKVSGVRVLVFSIGFGKELFGWTDKSGTRWKLCLIPLGGYVKMFGDKSAASTPDRALLEKLPPKEQKVAFHTKPLWIKSAIVVAGPLANYIFAIVILTFFFYIYGSPLFSNKISFVQDNSPAMSAGIKAGDKIVAIDNDDVETFSEIEQIVSLSAGISLNVRVDRDGELLNMNITPSLVEKKDVFGNIIKVGRLGVGSEIKLKKDIGVIESFTLSLKDTWRMSTTTLQALGQIVTGKRGTEDLGGPIKIAKYSGQSAKKGLGTMIWFMAILSINLGLINLFPIPMLDGGHLAYYLIEAIKGKPLTAKFQQYGFQIGLFLLIMLTVFTTWNDIRTIILEW
jgi:regulator of sigma E protease